MKIPEYMISIFLYLTYLVVFICAVIFYSRLAIDIRSDGGYIAAITLTGFSFLAFNMYFFFKLFEHMKKKRVLFSL